MNFEPQKFFIGVIDFFSILLPGILITYFIKDDVGPLFLGENYNNLSNNSGWLAFLVSSYLLGHFIFLIGSKLLDSPVYDKIRGATHNNQIKRLAKGRELSLLIFRFLAKYFIDDTSENAVIQVVQIKEKYLKPIDASSSINAFQWCKARLMLENPNALATVQRFEADSKFFRSLTVILPYFIVMAFIQHQTIIGLIYILLLSLAFWRFIDQRLKSVNQAYWYIITLEAAKSDVIRQSSTIQPGGISHAGGVVFKMIDKKINYLLVQAKKNPKELVLPKGHIEKDENMEETAVREVYEETGVWASIREPLSTVQYMFEGNPVKVQYYFMKMIKETKPKEERSPKWLVLEDIEKQVIHPEIKSMVRLAATKTIEYKKSNSEI